MSENLNSIEPSNGLPISLYETSTHVSTVVDPSSASTVYESLYAMYPSFYTIVEIAK